MAAAKIIQLEVKMVRVMIINPDDILGEEKNLYIEYFNGMFNIENILDSALLKYSTTAQVFGVNDFCETLMNIIPSATSEKDSGMIGIFQTPPKDADTVIEINSHYLISIRPDKIEISKFDDGINENISYRKSYIPVERKNLFEMCEIVTDTISEYFNSPNGKTELKNKITNKFGENSDTYVLLSELISDFFKEDEHKIPLINKISEYFNKK